MVTRARFLHLEHHTLGELASMTSMSCSRFSHTFHAVIGMSLRDCVRGLRLRRAHHLLLNSLLSLTTIAVDGGFYDLPHFDKAFRQRLGMSPQEFRRRHGGRRNVVGAANANPARPVLQARDHDAALSS